MARERPQKTLADYVAIAISPALIMLLVGSLAYFLLEATYDGQYAGRIRWVLFWLVFASVLVARIAIEQGRQHATVYWVAVGLAGMAVVFRLLDTYRLGVLALLAVIMWCANKLTWDCTLIDDSQDASGEGLLQVSGFDESDGQADTATRTPEATREPVWKRLLFNREERDDRPHAPGLWVVYFSLAALPLFGVGQLFIPVEDAESRDWGFRLLLVYVAAAMGLLLTTSFLGLRRYLRQRKLSMPGRMTVSWLITGAVMIALVLAVCLLLPRPGSETSIADAIDKVASKARDASRVAFLKDDAGQNEGTRTGRPEDQQPGDENQSGGGQQGRGGTQAGQSDDRDQPAERDGQSRSQGQERGAGQAQGQNGASGGGQQSGDAQGQASDQGEPPGGQDEGQSESGEQRQSGPQREPTDREQQARQQQSRQQPSGRRQSAGRQPSEREPDQRERQERQSGGGPGSQEQQRSEQEEQQRGGTGGGSRGRSEQQSNQSQSDSGASIPRAAEWVGRLVKFLLYLILAAVALYLIVRHWRTIVETLARMWHELRSLFASLFAGRAAHAATAAAAPDDLLAPVPPRPFRSFDNPFHTGAAGRMSPEELVIYTFRALEAWGYDHGYQRSADQTPLEYAAELSDHFPQVAGAARQTARLAARVAYAERGPGEGCREPLEAVWEKLTATARRPVMAG